MTGKPMSRLARRSARAGGAFALAAVSVCAGGSGASNFSSPSALAVVPGNASAESLVLQSEQYLFSPNRGAPLEYAADESSGTCVQCYGFSLPHLPRPGGLATGGLAALRWADAGLNAIRRPRRPNSPGRPRSSRPGIRALPKRRRTRASPRLSTPGRAA